MNQTKESALQIHPVDFEGAWNTESVDPEQYWQHGKFLFFSCLYMFARSPAVQHFVLGHFMWTCLGRFRHQSLVL